MTTRKEVVAMSEQEFANVDEALDAVLDGPEFRSMYVVSSDASKGTYYDRADRAREWLRALGTYARERGFGGVEMMTMREVLEAVANKEKLRLSHPNPTTENELSDFRYQLALLNAARVHAPMVPIWGTGGKSETRVSRAIHELALLMDAERSDEDGDA